MIISCNINDNDYQYQNVAYNTTKNCIGGFAIYVYVWLKLTLWEKKKYQPYYLMSLLRET